MRGGRVLGDAFGGVFFHLLVESLFVLAGHIFVLLFLLGGEGSPSFSEEGTHFDEFDSGEFFHDLGTMIEGEEDEGSSGAFGLFGVLLLLHVFFVEATFLDHVALGVISGGRDVGCHFGFVAGLVLGGVGFPSLFFLDAEGFVHVGGVLVERWVILKIVNQSEIRQEE